MPVEDAFLEIITHGPYHLEPKEEIEELCIVIHHALAPTLREQRKVQRSRSGTYGIYLYSTQDSPQT